MHDLFAQHVWEAYGWQHMGRAGQHFARGADARQFAKGQSCFGGWWFLERMCSSRELLPQWVQGYGLLMPRQGYGLSLPRLDWGRIEELPSHAWSGHAHPGSSAPPPPWSAMSLSLSLASFTQLCSAAYIPSPPLPLTSSLSPVWLLQPGPCLRDRPLHLQSRAPDAGHCEQGVGTAPVGARRRPAGGLRRVWKPGAGGVAAHALLLAAGRGT